MNERDEFLAAMANLKHVLCKDVSHVVEIRTAKKDRVTPEESHTQVTASDSR
jgi:hypothetical protein